MVDNSTILMINSGSSSVKFALFAGGASLVRLWSGAIERIGSRTGTSTRPLPMGPQ